MPGRLRCWTFATCRSLYPVVFICQSITDPLAPEQQQVINQLLGGMIIKYEAERWSSGQVTDG
jgi:hypothetical protein